MRAFNYSSGNFQELLPILDASNIVEEHVFSREELGQCAEGNCCRCGRCCVLYDIPAVPIAIGQAKRPDGISTSAAWFRSKAARALCPQHSFGDDGLATCACHTQKSSPIMDCCNGFIGDPETYADMIFMTQQMLFSPQTSAQVEISMDWQRRGILSDLPEATSIDQILKMVVKTLSLVPSVPSDLFDFLKVKKWLETDETTKNDFFSRLETAVSPEVFAEFRRYADSSMEMSNTST